MPILPKSRWPVRWRFLVSWFWLLPALCLLVGAVRITVDTWIGDGSQAETRDWSRAADRIRSRIGPAEVVLLHPNRNHGRALHMTGLPVVCTQRTKRDLVKSWKPDGFWVVTDEGLSGRQKRILGRHRNRGRLEIGEVLLSHGWARRNDKKKKGRGRNK